MCSKKFGLLQQLGKGWERRAMECTLKAKKKLQSTVRSGPQIANTHQATSSPVQRSLCGLYLVTEVPQLPPPVNHYSLSLSHTSFPSTHQYTYPSPSVCLSSFSTQLGGMVNSHDSGMLRVLEACTGNVHWPCHS